MEIVRTIKYIIILVTFFFWNCGNTLNVSNSKFKTNQTEIDIVLKQAKAQILNYLQKNKFNIDSLKLILVASCFCENTKDVCESIKKNKFNNNFVELFENLNFETNFVSALILDSNNQYIANSSPNTILSNPSIYKSYNLNQNLIQLFQKNGYIAYIEINCNPSYILGFNENLIDIYLKKQNNLEFIYSVKSEI